MAKPKSKYHYYVLVLTENGPMFVTGTEPGHVALWNKLEKPMEFSKEWAEDISLGLTLNGFNSFAIKINYELPSQPYRYNLGHFEWVKDKEVKDADKK